MSRYAPTLLVGIGGSGVHVVRWLKKRLIDDIGAQQLSDEPVSFVGIDFDPHSNSGTDVAPLEAAEFHFFDPAPIANCVNSLDRLVISSGDAEDQTPKTQFDEIRDWYPDLQLMQFRPSAAEANGASQWRPLGRIGFFLNDEKIIDALRHALIEADRRAGVGNLGDIHTAYVISSIAGGTGAGLLFDVTTNLRKIRSDLAVRSYLLLPELFETKPFRDRMQPNAYATLWEIANLKNQHVVFHARYPKIPHISRSESPSPMQRVFVFNGHVGDKRPFRDPEEAYPYIAEIIKLAITREIRTAGISAESNASADATAPLTAAESRHVFCTTAAMGMRLLTYHDLADLVLARLLFEIETGASTELLDLISPTSSVPTSGAMNLIRRATQLKDERFSFGSGYIKGEIDRFFSERAPYRSTYTYQDLSELVAALMAFCGTNGRDLNRPPDVTLDIQRRFGDAFRQELDLIRRSLGRRPRAFSSYLRKLEADLTKMSVSRRELPSILYAREFPEWLRNRPMWGSLAQALVPVRTEKMADATLSWFARETQPEDHDTWLKQAVVAASLRVIEELRGEERTRWRALAEMRAETGHYLRSGPAESHPFERQIFLDGWSANVTRALQHEAGRLHVREREEFFGTILDRFLSFYLEFAGATTDRDEILRRWVQSARDIFADRLAEGRDGDREGVGPRYRLVSPESLFTSEHIRAAILQCRPHVFQNGRVDAHASARIVRILLPNGFRGRTAYAETLRGYAVGLLAGSVSILDDDGDGERREDRIIIVVDDLFYPAEAINSIYDYHTQYFRHPTPHFLHIHRDWPNEFPPLITRPGARGRVTCGNPNCTFDLKTVDRARILCPGCHRPIRNRCGNRQCLSDDLGTRPDLDAIVSSGTCPYCRKTLRTYWWTCPDHGDVPIDKATCPRCVREGQRGRMARRPDFDGAFTCPGCVSKGVDEPFVVAGELHPFVIDGVDNHDYVRAHKVIDAQLNRCGHCPKCGTLLVPLCPASNPAVSRESHFLYRVPRQTPPDRFRCYDHTTLRFGRCWKCDFPVQEDDQLCRRCTVRLDDCRFCTPLFGIRIPAAAETAPCPNCTLPRKHDRALGTGESGSPDALFCSNLYGCPAGRRLDTVSYPPGTDHCRLCGSPGLPLLKVLTRADHLTACRHCSTLFGLEDTESNPRPNGSNANCCLCGRSFTKTRGASKEQFAEMVTISRALRCHDDHDGTFRALHDTLAAQDRPVLDRKLADFVRGIERPAVRRTVSSRVERLIEEVHRHYGCRDATPADPSKPSSDC